MTNYCNVCYRALKPDSPWNCCTECLPMKTWLPREIIDWVIVTVFGYGFVFYLSMMLEPGEVDFQARPVVFLLCAIVPAFTGGFFAWGLWCKVNEGLKWLDRRRSRARDTE